jgi:hypothetical protein
MNKETISLHYSDTSSDRIERPDENVSIVKGDVFAVCDGVTVMHQDPYPNPSPAAEVAELAGKSISTFLMENSGVEGVGLLQEAFSLANDDVKEFNIEKGVSISTVDHLDKQYAGLTCSFGYVRDGTLYFAQINDCGVMVFDQMGNREVDFILNQTPFMQFMEDKEKEGLDPDSSEHHVFVRSEVVNQRDLEFGGKLVHFGVLNGEKSAEHFLHYGSSRILPGQIVLFYTNGFIPFVYDEQFVQVLFEFDENKLRNYIEQRVQDGDKYRKEKDLIAVRFSDGPALVSV